VLVDSRQLVSCQREEGDLPVMAWIMAWMCSGLAVMSS
jgi:hypothetical protein